MRRAGGGPINSERLKPAESEWERKAADGSEAAMRDFKREGCSGEAGGDNGRDVGTRRVQRQEEVP